MKTHNEMKSAIIRTWIANGIVLPLLVVWILLGHGLTAWDWVGLGIYYLNTLFFTWYVSSITKTTDMLMEVIRKSMEENDETIKN